MVVRALRVTPVPRRTGVPTAHRGSGGRDPLPDRSPGRRLSPNTSLPGVEPDYTTTTETFTACEKSVPRGVKGNRRHIDKTRSLENTQGIQGPTEPQFGSQPSEEPAI